MGKQIKFIIRDARVQISGILLLLWIAEVFKEPTWQVIIYPLSSVILLSVLDLSLTYARTKKIYYPFSSLVSGLLIGFLLHYSQGIITLTVAVILAFLSKQFFKIKHHHIFNPAAFGVVFSTLIFGSHVSWWATASGGISLALILPVIYVLYKLKRLQFTCTFIIGYFIFFASLQGLKAATSLTLDGTVFLFSFIMLTEPMGSSITKFWKWAFGPVVLVGVIISYFLKISFTDPLLISLLFANLLVRITNK